MRTGECTADRRLKLRRYETLQKGDELYVVI
jgi:nitrite reductase/ring-hydroxylating ferredoxin subunit